MFIFVQSIALDTILQNKLGNQVRINYMNCLYNLQSQSKIFLLLFITQLMFLQRFRKSISKEFVTPQKQIKQMQNVTDILKQMSPSSEIKKHQKKNIYINPRTYLIENTKKHIRPIYASVKQNPLKGDKVSERLQETHCRNRDSLSRTSVNLSSRDARRQAAKRYRQKIWKSTDISQISKILDQKWRRSSRFSADLRKDSDQKIYRYQDSMEMLKDHDLDEGVKQKLKKKWLEGAVKNNLNYRKNSSYKNPQKLQITNIEFKQQNMQQSTGSNQSVFLVSRQRRRDPRFMHYSTTLRQDRRPNTTGGHNRQRIQDHIIEPW